MVVTADCKGVPLIRSALAAGVGGGGPGDAHLVRAAPSPGQG